MVTSDQHGTGCSPDVFANRPNRSFTERLLRDPIRALRTDQHTRATPAAEPLTHHGATALLTSTNGGIEMGKSKRLAAVGAVGIMSLAALALQQGTSSAGGVVARAELRNQANELVGTVVFKKHGQEIVGRVVVDLPHDAASSEFRGFHIHANNLDTTPADGLPDGCVASTGFTSVGGHWDDGTHSHGKHLGDLPVLMRDANGHAAAEFVIGKFQPGTIVGKAVIVHAGPDSYANVPTRYVSSNGPSTGGPDSTTLATGDAGSRYACGVIVSEADDE